MGISELQRLIENSALSDQDKDMWLRTLEVMDDDQAAEILEVVSEDPHELEEMTRNIKLKQVAFAKGDVDLMGQILEEEKEDIMDL